MAKAYMCDRCGSYYLADGRFIEGKYFITTNPCTTTGIVDLCQHCRCELYQWMEKEDTYEEQVTSSAKEINLLAKMDENG